MGTGFTRIWPIGSSSRSITYFETPSILQKDYIQKFQYQKQWCHNQSRYLLHREASYRKLFCRCSTGKNKSVKRRFYIRYTANQKHRKGQSEPERRRGRSRSNGYTPRNDTAGNSWSYRDIRGIGSNRGFPRVSSGGYNRAELDDIWKISQLPAGAEHCRNPRIRIRRPYRCTYSDLHRPEKGAKKTPHWISEILNHKH